LNRPLAPSWLSVHVLVPTFNELIHAVFHSDEDVPRAYVKVVAGTMSRMVEVPETVNKPFRFKFVPVALPQTRLVVLAFVAKRLVDVVFVPVAFVQMRFVTVSFVDRELVANRLVLVVFVPVALVQVRLVGVKFVAVKFVNDAFVANRFVDVALVDVVFVNTPVEGVVAPIGELLIVPPLMVRMSEILVSVNVPLIVPKLPMASVTPPLPSVPELMAEALILPVESIVRPFTTMASVTELLGNERPPVTARFVVVTDVPVAFVNVSVWSDEAPVAVRVVNRPVEAVVAPTVVPLMEPPVKATFEEFNVANVPVNALLVVPDAVAKPNQDVEVPFVNVRFVTVSFVMTPVVAKR
jgi:hypothetical protein